MLRRHRRTPTDVLAPTEEKARVPDEQVQCASKMTPDELSDLQGGEPVPSNLEQ